MRLERLDLRQTLAVPEDDLSQRIRRDDRPVTTTADHHRVRKHQYQYQPQFYDPFLSIQTLIEIKRERDEIQFTHIQHPTAQTTLCLFLLFPPVPRALNLPTLIRPTTRPVARLNFLREESEWADMR
jgi:hypothetical protein